MEVLAIQVPKTIHLNDNIFLFGSEWEMTITGVDNLFCILIWCDESLGDIKVEYYAHSKNRWYPLNDLTKLALSYVNNKNDYTRIRFKDDVDAMAFKLRWL